MTSPPLPTGDPSDPWASPPSPPPSSGPPAAGAFPPFAGGFGAPGPVIAQIGEIAVTSAVVGTPAGDIPLAGSTWQVADYWHNEQKIPTWAIVAALVGVCFTGGLSLLLLLVKQTVHRGTVQVTVTNGARQYVARLPVTDQAQVQYVHQQVNYVRSLAAL